METKMRLINRLSGHSDKVTIILTGQTYAVKDTIKAHGFRFAPNGGFCQLIADLGPLWYSIKDVPLNEITTALTWTKELANHAIDVVLIDGGYV